MGCKKLSILAQETNHLGNVLSVVSDRRYRESSSGVIAYNPVILSATDYYPFGMEMPGRSISSNSYRYGFNGKEKDSDGEWGTQTHYDYGFRIYNPAIGKFLSVDPLTAGYPNLTPYQYASNRPIDGIDLDGLEYVRFQYLPTDYGMAFINVSTQYTVDWTLNPLFKNITLKYPVGKAFILEHGGKNYIFGSFTAMNNAVGSITFDNYYETIADGIPGVPDDQTLEVNEGAGDGLAYVSGAVAGLLMHTSSSIIKPNVASHTKVGSTVTKDVMIRKGHLNSAKKSSMKSIRDAQQVVDNYHAGKLEVLEENIHTGQITVRDPSVTGTWRSNKKVGENKVLPISKELNIFVIKGGTKKRSKGKGVSVFPKNPDNY